MKICGFNWKSKFTDTKLKYNDFRDILIEFNDKFSFELDKMTTLIGTAKDINLQLDTIIKIQEKTLETLLSCSMFSREMNTLVNSSKLRNAK